MSPAYVRAELLLDQNRAREALDEIQVALLEDPEDAHAHAIIARCQTSLGHHQAAIVAARQAVTHAADEPYMHRVLAYVLFHAGRNREALDPINDALRLEPDDDHALALRSSIHRSLRDWPNALADAEAALAINPENVEALNCRSLALIQLGRAAEAHTTGDFALQREPENGITHATKGWACLHQHNPKTAQTHFREALRLEPDLEYARHGMLEALKARNPIYRGMLAYFLWIGRQSSRVQWAFVIFSLFGVKLVRQLASSNPSLGIVLWPLVGLFYAFIYLTWTAVPLFNLMLRFNRFGRLVLSRAESRASIIFGLSLLPLFASLIWWARGAGVNGLVASIMTAILSVCVAATVRRTGRNLAILGAATVALTVVGAFAFTSDQGDLFTGFFLGFLGFQFLANALER